MSDARPLDRIVADWLQTEAPMRAREGSLDVVMQRVAQTDQQPHLTQRLFGRERGRSRALRLALVAGLVASLLAATALLIGSFRETELTSGTEGWVLFGRQGGPIGSHEGTEIWLLRPGEAPEPAIAAAAGVDRDCPALAPDGREIAYVEHLGTGRDASLVVAALVKSGGVEVRHRISLDALPSVCPRWSPVGGLLAYGAGSGALMLASSEAGTVRELVAPSADAVPRDLVWSPDATRLAVTTGGRIDLVPVDGGAPVTLAESRGNQGPATGAEEFDGVAWSPDGRVLAVWGENNFASPGGSFMRVIQIDGSGQANLPVRGPVAAPRWSPVGSRLAFIENRADIVVYQNSGVPGEAAQLVRLPRLDPDADGSRAGIATFVWSADGQRIVFSLFRIPGPPGQPGDDESALAEVLVDGASAPVLLLPFDADFFTPAGAQAASP